MKKKFLAMLLIFTLAITLVACSNNDSAVEDTEVTGVNSEVTEEMTEEVAEETETDGIEEQESENKIQEPVLIGSADATPWTMLQEDGSIEGVGMDFIDELMNRLGWEYEMVMTDIPGMFGNIDSGRVDMLGLKLALTPERADKYDHSIKYYWDPAKLVVREDDDTITTMEDLKGKTIAAGSGQVSLEFIESYKEKHDSEDEINVLILDSGAMEAVQAGQADAAIGAEPNFLYREAQEPRGLKLVGEPIYAEEAAILFPKGTEPEIIEEVNDAIRSMQDDGYMSKLFTDFFGVDTSQPIEINNGF